jgi:branched-chain amino acid transport system substrate-binding protein
MKRACATDRLLAASARAGNVLMFPLGGIMRRIIIGLVAAAVAAPATHAEQGSRPTRIVIGATVPMTGSESKAGNMYKDGIQLAFEQLSAAGGLEVGGKRVPVELRLLDDESKGENATKLVEKLVQDGADFLISTYSTALVEPQSAVAERLRVPYVAGAASATPLYERGFKYLFGLQSPVDELANALLRYIDDGQRAGKLPNPMRLAVAWENTAHGKDFRSGVHEFATKTPNRRSSYQIVLDESFELNTKDFKPLLSRVQNAKAHALLADAHLPDYIAMHKQYLASGMCLKVVTYGARGSEKDAVAALPPHGTDYVLSAVWWNAQLGAKGLNKDFVEAFKAKYKRAPEWYPAMGYEASRALFTAIEKAGSSDRERVREALANLKMESIVPGGYLMFPKEYGYQARYLFLVQQNQPDGTSPIVYPRIAATNEGSPANPNCN